MVRSVGLPDFRLRPAVGFKVSVSATRWNFERGKGLWRLAGRGALSNPPLETFQIFQWKQGGRPASQKSVAFQKEDRAVPCKESTGQGLDLPVFITF